MILALRLTPASRDQPEHWALVQSAATQEVLETLLGDGEYAFYESVGGSPPSSFKRLKRVRVTARPPKPVAPKIEEVK